MKSNTILIIVITVIVAGSAYWFFFTGTGNEPPLSTDAPPTNQAQLQFETLVGELQPISFNVAIFSDARFNVLVDITTPIAPESIGRLDPLAPISAASAVMSPVAVSPAMSPVTNPVSGTSSPALGGY